MADVRLVASFTRFNPSMAMFSEESALSSPFDCLNLSVMVEMQGGGVSKGLNSIIGMSPGEKCRSSDSEAARAWGDVCERERASAARRRRSRPRDSDRAGTCASGSEPERHVNGDLGHAARIEPSQGGPN